MNAADCNNSISRNTDRAQLIAENAEVAWHHQTGRRNQTIKDMGTLRIGLVLAGGGAKGAYEIGVLDYLAQIGCQIVAIAGTSVGALNGAVLAGEPSLASGVRLLAALWEYVSEQLRVVAPTDALAADSAQEGTLQQLRLLGPRLLYLRRFADALERIVDDSVDFRGVQTGRGLWVSAYPFSVSTQVPHQIRYLVEICRRIGGARGVILRVNDYPEVTIREAVLASAALPFIFPPRSVEGFEYVDGSFAERDVRALVSALADGSSCDALVIVRLRQRAVVSCALPNHLLHIDICPSVPLDPVGPVGWLSGLVAFSPERVRVLRSLGYNDARLHFERLLGAAGAPKSRSLT